MRRHGLKIVLVMLGMVAACSAPTARTTVQVRVAVPQDFSIPMGVDQTVMGDFQVEYGSESSSAVRLTVEVPDNSAITILRAPVTLAESSSSPSEGRYGFGIHPVRSGATTVTMDVEGDDDVVIRDYPGSLPRPWRVDVTVNP